MLPTCGKRDYQGFETEACKIIVWYIKRRFKVYNIYLLVLPLAKSTINLNRECHAVFQYQKTLKTKINDFSKQDLCLNRKSDGKNIDLSLSSEVWH